MEAYYKKKLDAICRKASEASIELFALWKQLDEEWYSGENYDVREYEGESAPMWTEMLAIEEAGTDLENAVSIIKDIGKKT